MLVSVRGLAGALLLLSVELLKLVLDFTLELLVV